MNKKDKNNKNTNKNNEQGIFETVRRINEQERRRAEEKQKKFEKSHEKKREQYSKQIAEDKIELLKLKQGISDNLETSAIQSEKKKKYTFRQKLSNFIYHNKWWLGITSFLVIMAAFLIYDKLTTIRPDVIVMLLCDDTDIYARYDDIAKYFDSLTDDYNQDDKYYADIMYIPVSEDENTDSGGLYESNLAKLSTEFQMGESMLVIADSNADELIMPEESFTDLERLFPDTAGIKGTKLYLKDTGFAEKIGFEGTLPDDLYIAVRKVSSHSFTPQKDMQKNHENAMEVLERLIEDIDAG